MPPCRQLGAAAEWVVREATQTLASASPWLAGVPAVLPGDQTCKLQPQRLQQRLLLLLWLRLPLQMCWVLLLLLLMRWAPVSPGAASEAQES